MPLEGWRELTLGALVRGGRGFQTGPFGSELRAAESSRDELCDGLRLQRRHGKLAALPMRGQLTHECVQRMAGDRRLHRAIRREHQQPRRLRPSGETPEQRNGRRVAPMQVLECEHERALGGEHLERLGQLSQHALARRLVLVNVVEQ